MTNNDTVSEFSSFRGRGSIAQIVQELRRQIDARFDFVVDTRDLAVRVDDSKLKLFGTPSSADYIPRAGIPLGRTALRQLGERATPSIPLQFLERAIEEAPGRIADFITGVMHDHSERRLVRVLDNQVRAVLGSTYRCIDNLDVAQSVLTAATESNARLLEATLSDDAMRIKLLNPSIVEEIERVRSGGDGGGWYAGGLGSPEFLNRVRAHSRGDLPTLPNSGPNSVLPIVTVGNSETGKGSFNARVGILQAICFNLATVETKLTQVHLGGRLETGVFTRETIEAEADLILRKGRDVMRTAFDPARFRELVEAMRETAGQKIHRPIQAVEAAIKIGKLGEGSLDALVSALMGEPGGASVYNVGQAVARVAQDLPDGDQAEEWEAFAGEILTGKHSRHLVAAGAES